MKPSSPDLSPGRLPGGYYAMGGGLVGLLVHLFIWRMIWRLALLLWRIPTFGPVIVGLIGVAAVTLLVLRAGGGGPWRNRRRRGGLFDYGSGGGPRDW